MANDDCGMGVGCKESGTCYAEANGAPHQCPKYEPQPGLHWVRTEEMDEDEPHVPAELTEDGRVWVVGFDEAHTRDEIIEWGPRLLRLEEAPEGGPEPGELIGHTSCTACGARLRVEYGDDVGVIMSTRVDQDGVELSEMVNDFIVRFHSTFVELEHKTRDLLLNVSKFSGAVGFFETDSELRMRFRVRTETIPVAGYQEMILKAIELGKKHLEEHDEGQDVDGVIVDDDISY